MQSKQLHYFDNYIFGGHADIKCKSFNVALIKFQLKNQNRLQKSHTFCSKLISTFFPRILAQCVVYVNFHRFAHNHLFKAYCIFVSFLSFKDTCCQNFWVVYNCSNKTCYYFSGVDFWTSPIANGTVDVMVSPKYYRSVTNFLHSYQIPYKVKFQFILFIYYV